MRTMEYKTLHFELESASVEIKGGQEYGIIKGAMATEDVDRWNDQILSTAFDKTLARHRKEKRRIKLYYQHNTGNVPIGGIEPKNVTKNGKRWDVVGELDFGVGLAKEVYSALQNKNLSDMSIGFSITESDFEDNKRIIKELELWEVSVVGEPMNPKADITEVKEDGGAERNRGDVEKIISPASLSQDEKNIENNIESNIFIEYKDICDKIHTKRDFEKLLRDSGVFSKKAATYLSSITFSDNQSDSGLGEEVKSISEKIDQLNTNFEFLRG